ncbi:MAG: Na-translocating system protein MpsC family protein [Nitrospira sp.]|nr:Na-translocating system protein MpsC family protein [Nitrospira sp.]
MHSEALQQQGALEAAVRKAVCQFQLEFMAGSFAERIRVLVASDMIIVRSQGVLPAAEQHLARTEEGQALVKQLYRTLFAQQRRILVNQVAAITGMVVTDVLTDFAVSTGEQVMAFLFTSHDED